MRKNLWTMLGAPAVGLTGEVESSGLLVCRTALTSLRAIGRNDPIAGELCVRHAGAK